MLEFSFSKVSNFLEFYFNFEGKEGFNSFKVNWKNKDFFVGKENKKIVLIISSNDERKEKSVEKKTLKVGMDVLLLNQKMELTTKGELKVCRTNVIKLNFTDKKEEEILMIFVWNIINNYEESALENIFGEELRELKEVFEIGRYKYVNKNWEGEIIGLYGELVVLYLLLNKYGKNAYKWWRKDKLDRFDFSISNEVKIEVKTSLKNGRNHRFSHHQLYSLTEEILIASCFLVRDKKGKSLREVYFEVKEIIKNDWEISQDLDKKICEIGIYAESRGPAFNFSLALERIKFYDAKNIPKYEYPEPFRVTNTHYCVLLEDLPEEKIEEWVVKKQKLNV